MNNQSNSWKSGVVFFSFAALVGAATLAVSCGHPNTGSQATPCTGGAGSELCPCMAGNVCMTGLVCATDKNECVSLSGGGGTTGAGNSTGAAGTTGSSGAAGTMGTTGIAGTNGAAGTTGATGVAGTTGSTGVAGTTGTTGVAGTTGATGSAGTTGSSGTNLIINGDFSMGMTDWAVPNGAPTNVGVNNGQFCLTLATNNMVVVGWGSSSTSASVSPGTNYTLSYQASSTGSLSMFEVHVGQVISPYAVDYNDMSDTLANNLNTFSHGFTVSNADTQAGLAFVMNASNGTPTVCIDNVSLKAN